MESKNLPFNFRKKTGVKNYMSLLLIAGLLLLLQSARAQVMYGISANNLISFDASAPGALLSSKAITGITSGQAIEGIDFRPINGKLYALGYDWNNTTYQVYTMDLSTAVATAVNAVPGTINLGTSPVPGKHQIGFDFNPTVDRIRVVSTKDQNYRLNPNDGSVAATDLNLNYAAGDIAQGFNPRIAGVAYTNSYAGATATTLYDFDCLLGSLSSQNPPNNGTLVTIGYSGITVGKGDQSVDLDIYFDPGTYSNKAFLNANVAGSGKNDYLYSLDLSTGEATSLGLIGGGIPVSDIAAFIDRTVPDVSGNLIYAITSNNNLISLDSDDPSIVRTQVAVTGVTVGQSIVGMDFRPATKALYILGYNATSGESQLYTVNLTSGIATAVNSTPVVLALGGTAVGFDFNPTVDKIRVVSTADVNYRLDPLTGGIFATDLNLNYAAGDANEGVNPSVNAVGYTNSFAGSATTALYDYDYLLNVLSNQNPPNNGTLVTIGASGISVNTADPSIDLDIYSDLVSNYAFLSANSGISVNDVLYSVDLATGESTSLGMIGYGVAVKNIACSPDGSLKQELSGKSAIRPEVSLFPNPAREVLKVTVDGHSGSEMYMEIFNVSGSRMMAETIENAASINISALPEGGYLLRITVNGETAVKQFIKN